MEIVFSLYMWSGSVSTMWGRLNELTDRMKINFKRKYTFHKSVRKSIVLHENIEGGRDRKKIWCLENATKQTQPSRIKGTKYRISKKFFFFIF